MTREDRTEPCVIVIFGASGDLTHRKLIPALYELDSHARLPKGTVVLGVSRTPMSDESFRDTLKGPAAEHAAGFDNDKWNRFANRVHYYAGDATNAESFAGLKAHIVELAKNNGIQKQSGTPNILFYLAVAPTLYEPIIERIGGSGLVSEDKLWCSVDRERRAWQRIIIEKPFGEDLESARSLNMALGRVFEEEATFRIDHYLGKELVQNMIVLRFANSIFEPLWNAQYVDHVQVTAAETVGVGSRAANFYDRAGALRDMVQSHLLQVLAFVAMEAPASYTATAILREKIRLFESAEIFSEREAAEHGVLGRYGPGPQGEPAYVEEKGVDPAKNTETFAAMTVRFDTWRWGGVPFYLRSGKRMAAKLTEVVIQFRHPPTNLFRTIDPALGHRPANRMIINIAPNEGISLRIEGRVPGAGLTINSAKLDLDYHKAFGGERLEAYGPLILDAIAGDRTLYKHREEVEGAWRIAEPFLKNEILRAGIEDYAPGTWGPPTSDLMLSREGRIWHNPTQRDVR